MDAEVVFDSRWAGDHGIGRFSTEVSARLPWKLETIEGAHPVSVRGLAELDLLARRARTRSGAQHFLSPGYCPPIFWPGTLSFAIHDLIHLDVAHERSAGKQLYYQRVVRPVARRAQVIYTVSEYSQRRIIEWADVAEDKVIVVGNGVDEKFFGPGAAVRRSRPYVLHVGNHKPHKNLPRLIAAVSMMRNKDFELVLSGQVERGLVDVADTWGMRDRIAFVGRIPEEALANWYRGAEAVAIPSLYEGFGLPALEAMAAATPVVASEVSALPEVVGDVGIMVDPDDAESIAAGLDRAVADVSTRERAARLGPERARLFSWDGVAERVALGTAIA